jgi:hypothetical protein
MIVGRIVGAISDRFFVTIDNFSLGFWDILIFFDQLIFITLII